MSESKDGLSPELRRMAEECDVLDMSPGDSCLPVAEFEARWEASLEAFARLVAADCTKILDGYLDNGANPELALANIRRKYGLEG